MKTHRCEGSLKARIPIRFIMYAFDKEFKWRLFEIVDDYERLSIYPRYISEIKYCPFCGEELKGKERIG